MLRKKGRKEKETNTGGKKEKRDEIRQRKY